MDLRQFAEKVRDELREVMGVDFDIEIYKCKKNNSVDRIGLNIKEKTSQVAPVIYTEDFYDDYVAGREIDSIVSEILRLYSGNKNGPDEDPQQFQNFEWAKYRIFYKLVNAERNQELLKDAPHDEIMDLAMIYGVYMGDYRGAFSSVTIGNMHLEMWGVTKEEIRKLALENTPRLMPSKLWSMEDLLKEMGVNEECDDVPMYILSNKDRINGAATLLYDGELAKIADNLHSDLFVLPSSIHEVILVPAETGMNENYIKSMIENVNNEQVSAEEILSYTLYKYDRENGLKEVA